MKNSIIVSAFLLVLIVGISLVSAQPEKITIVHYKNGATKLIADKKLNSTCYFILGARWDKPVDYVINPSNNQNLSEKFIVQEISSGTREWDRNTNSKLFNKYTIDYTPIDYHYMDGKNSYIFTDFYEANAIAATVLWGYFTGNGTILEYDVIFNTLYPWGDGAKNPSVLDLRGISTHETGHCLGLGDLYDSSCSQETMFGYSGLGDTRKRTLNSGDIVGLRMLY